MYRIKTVKNFRQADSRWGKLGYKTAPKWTMQGCGCGPTACADIIASNQKHTKVTPATTRRWMINHNYATNGNGTMWSGIAACLKAYGFKVTNHPDMASFFKEMKKGNRRAVILFRKGSRGGVTWTMDGHFVAVSGYKYENKKHYLYTCDPGPRHNDGWHCYETTMKGLIPQIWSCYLPEPTKKEPAKKPAAKKPVKKPVKKPEPTAAQKLIAEAKETFAYMTKEKFKYKKSGAATSWAQAKKEKTSDCSHFVCYCLQQMGLLKPGEWFWCDSKIHYHGGLTKEKLSKIATISYPKKSPKAAKLKPGDICGYPTHTQIFAGWDAKGNAQWYSFGPTDVGTHLPRKRGKYNTREVAVLIRLK